MKKIPVLLLLLAFCISADAQETFPVNGARPAAGKLYYFTNATIHTGTGETLEKAEMLVRDGWIEEIGARISAPSGAVIVDLKGRHVYPSFIDLYAAYGIPEVKVQEASRSAIPQYESAKKGAYSWNQAIHPEVSAASLFSADPKAAATYRELGFGAVLSHVPDGIARGTSVFTTLADAKENKTVLRTNAAAHYSFRKGTSKQAYPSSLMGAIALLRQTFLDAQWYAAQKHPVEENISLRAWNEQQELPQIFEANDKYNILRADRIGDEFGLQYIFKTDGREYQRIAEVKATGGKFIIPISFPDPYAIEDPYEAMLVSFEELRHWELAPANPKFLYESELRFAFTIFDLKDKKQFWNNLRKAVRYGLPEEEALKALTLNPAAFVGMDKWVGSLEKGKLANFLITSGPLFEESTILYQNWIQGERYIVQPDDVADVRGTYDLNIDNHIYTVQVKGELKSPVATLKADTATVKIKLAVEQRNISLGFTLHDNHYQGAVRLSGVINFDSGSWDGNGQLPDGSWIKWNAIRKQRFKEEKKTPKAIDSLDLIQVSFPQTAYGFDSLPRNIPVLIKNATVWTNESEGILYNTDLLLREGKIVRVGKILDVVDRNTWVIDGTGKHVTAGIIDEHSHIAISGGVNEGSHAVTAEVSIADVINPDDINIYRQLSGGVTASQLLHGSANPVGGQSAMIKLRWGLSAEEMKVEGAEGFIKFALGENVKQSNWGEHYTLRFPQTRMGVEQVFYDAFYRAREYEQQWKNYESLSRRSKHNAEMPRKDLQLEVLLEILNGKRFITCHSYVQSEINMLMKVADSLGFKVNTFTHILEGYKLADKMKAHGAAASTFSDWWAYKYEVNDAIPFNAALLQAMGVLTAINSDDAEMGRRLNQEAAKAVKYGGMSEEEAWKMVTLNPAKMLHLDQRMGSIRKGKDADIVIWSEHPLSVYAKAEKTFIDGICYFDRERDVLLRLEMRRQQSRIAAKMMKAKSDSPTRNPQRKEPRLYHCETLEEYEEHE